MTVENRPSNARARRVLATAVAAGLLASGGIAAAPTYAATPAVGVKSASLPILRVGMSSSLVKRVQVKLGVRATGYFGPQTLAAVKRFQARKGIPTTGNVGPLTWAALNRSASKAPSSSSRVRFPFRVGMRAPIISQLQRRLKMPVVTGYYGTMTASYVAAFQRAARLPVTGRVNVRTWARIGKVSFTPPGAVSPAPAPSVVNRGSTAERVLAVAKSLQGIPYVATGNSPKTGFNCSSYTQYVYERVGINLGGAYTVTQYAQSRKITAAQARPGDLIFYYNYPNNFIGHVGIYAGNGKFWHAPRTGRVVSLDSIYSSKVLFGRVI